MRVDYIIVGQGLAGSALAMALLDRGKSLLVIDRNDEDAASRVAAGLVTTLAGKGMNPAWRQTEYLPRAIEYYKALEAESGRKLFHSHPVLRLFSDEKEALKFERKKNSLSEWVSESCEEICADQVHGEFGGFEMACSGRLDTEAYLDVVRSRIEKDAHFLEADFSFDEVRFSEKTVNWREFSANKLILCQGFSGLGMGPFADVPHRSAKGEMLTVSVEKLEQSRILNRNGWMVPIGENLWRAGASYEWDDLTTEPSSKGKELVEEKVRQLTPLAFDTLKQEVGIRPIIQRSQPVVGFHREHCLLGFFNGLGSKGVITAPCVAEHFAAVLEEEAQLDPELSIERL